MANKNLFTAIGQRDKTDALNNEGRHAYAFSSKHALAQYAITGCLNTTFYANAEEQLEKILELCNAVEPEFIARAAVYCRERGYMKDVPALLCAVLSVKSPGLLCEVFDRVIDNGKMLQNFVQIIRSGAVGRKSLGTMPKRLVQKWLEKRGDDAVFKASVGQNPSLADIIKMVHPKPATPQREALYGYLIGREHNAEMLPALVKQYEAFKAKATSEVPDVPFRMLTSLELGKNEWKAIAKNAPWQMTRMNLNTFTRHGVFEGGNLANTIAERLRDPQLVKKARVFPYQLMMAYTAASNDLPKRVRNALQDAMELAIKNVPQIDGKVYVFPDISGSMHSPVTGFREGATTAVRCIDVAALVAAAMVRKNEDAEVLPFESNVVNFDFNPRDSVLTNASRMTKLPCGGTNCSAPLAELNRRHAKGDLVVYVSDNESWVDSPHHGHFGGSRTATMTEWEKFKSRNPRAKMVCIDIQPYATTQAKERHDILNIGGFSDQVFNVIADFAAGKLNANHWVGVIEAITL
jgi:60 kDa SS-A/Ro ribonucleoprotein